MTAKATPDILGLCLGLTGWIFPDLHVAIKIGLTLVVICIIIFIRMDKAKQTSAINAAGRFVENYAMPALGGGLRALFIALFAIIIVDGIFDIHLVDYKDYYIRFGDSGSSSHTSNIAQTFLHALGNLTRAGNIVLVIAVFIGAAMRVSDTAAKKRKQTENIGK